MYPKNRKRRAIVDRFWEKVERKGPNECWPWRGKYDKQGYGVFYIDRMARVASRIAWILTNGEPLPGYKVRHTCDRPWCCNPQHLVQGTQADNIRDMWERGRCRVFRGEQAGNAKLTEDAVRKIRAEYVPGIFGCNKLARKFGTTKENITKILQRKSWTHLE